ncbi:TPA: restriction endonuclease subunit S [Escherichia coli]|uniref:restriction endonuclease subunit S n=1 Tax=Escherichia coli TaxID=562 RepID=UPI000BE8CC1A|nr:restriction endonuclease subunit S [Escherichia coli]EIQ7648485.1 restriction endonuclease subunit S [Escherichia coli]HAW1482332.1 restriction endonuclease subunit S [Escherichia coli]
MSELSYLEKLLDGVEVEWLPLSGLARIRNGKDHKSLSEGEFPVYGSGGIMRYVDTYAYNKPSVLIPRKGSLGNLFFVNVPFWTVDTIFYTEIDEAQIRPKYLYYFLTTVGLGEMNQAGGVPSQTQSVLNKLKIPIPCPDNPEKSLAIQSEIVRILDKFTALTAELTAELNMRKKQYNYYRDQLLSFDESSVEWKTLLEACDYVDYRGKTPKKTQSGIFLVTAKNIRMGYIDYHASQEFISEEDYAIVMRRGLPKKGDVLITTEAPCGFVAQVNRENIALAQRVIKYRSKNTQLSNSFLKHYLLGSQFQDKLMQAATGSTVKGIKGSRLHQLKIPIPSKVEQDRIVAILDKFDTLTNSITEGLPREIELRQKQYEYYRDLLFSFPTPETVSN